MLHLRPVEIRKNKFADYAIEQKGRIETLKKSCYRVVEGYSIGGEAPKSFIRVYEYGACRKRNPESWILYIAKTGHKWYPLESVTEHLIARIGSTLGLDMAESRLVYAGNQLRFLSKYFLKPELGQELVHGSNILATYLGDDSFVVAVENNRRESEFFTLQETIRAIIHLFPAEYPEIIKQFSLMLCFDAWVGVQDRHFHNWGVVRNIYGSHAPYFSPIYDSARGLFWNFHESKINEWIRARQLEQQIENQIKNSMPQVGLEGRLKANHFEVVRYLLSDHEHSIRPVARKVFTSEALQRVQKMIHSEFSGLLSPNRILLITKCLEIRHQHFTQLFT